MKSQHWHHNGKVIVYVCADGRGHSDTGEEEVCGTSARHYLQAYRFLIDSEISETYS